MKPLAIDLYCGLGGWTEGLLAEGYRVVGFDIEQHVYGGHRYPAQLVLQDVLTIHGRQLKEAALIVASPPCQEYSYMAMPWSKAKQKRAEYLNGTRDVKQLTALFDACFRIQQEASEAAGRHIPLVVENVRGAQRWVGRAKANYGSFFLWGDIESVGGRIVAGPYVRFGVPMLKARKVAKVGGLDWKHPDDPRHRPGQAFNPAAQGAAFREARENGIKVGDAGWRESGPGRQLQDRAIKNAGGSWFNIGSPDQKETGRNPVHELSAEGVKGSDGYERNHPNALGWKSPGTSSKSHARKAASAMIAKIPLALSRHIGRAWYPERAA